MTKRGKFIVLEGVDGCGKGTLDAHLRKVLPGEKVIFTREPGGTALGTQLRELLQHTEMDVETELLLFEAGRREHIKRLILPTLESGVHVISDRFDASTFAYQAQSEEEREFFATVNSWVTRHCRPDLYIFLDLPIEVSMERTKTRGEDPTVFESRPPEYFERVQAGYREFFATLPHVVIDANRSPESILAEAEKIIRKELGL